MLVPSPAFRSMALGIMLAVVFILAATLTLLPAVLAKLGPRVDKARAAVGALRRAPLAALRRVGRAAVAATGRASARSPSSRCSALAIPVLDLKTGMPSIKVVPGGDSSRTGYEQVQAAFGSGAPGALQIVAPAATNAWRGRRRADRRPRDRAGHAAVARRAAAGADLRRSRAATRRASRSAPRSTACARRCRPARWSAARSAENHDLEMALAAKTPLVIGVVLALGFLLLLVALQAPMIAASACSRTCWPPAPRSASPS